MPTDPCAQPLHLRGEKPPCSSPNLPGNPCKVSMWKGTMLVPRTVIFWAVGACPCSPSASSTACCQLPPLKQELNCPGEGRAIPPLLHSISACCLGSLGQNLISFKFKTKQALVYFLCFALFHIYKGIFFVFIPLLLTFITSLASSDSLPSNYPCFFFSKPRQSTGNQKGYCGHSGPPLPSGSRKQAGTQGYRDTGTHLLARSQLPHPTGL